MQSPPFGALIDIPSGALLTLSLRPPIIAFLAKSEPDAQPFWNVNFPHYARSFPIADADPLTFPQWSWVLYKRQFEPTPPSLLTDRVRAASALAVKKSYALFEMISSISTVRNMLCTGVLMQESVHLTKKMQAQQYKNDGYPDDDHVRYPYVLQYAEVIGVPMREAANEIIFKAQLDDEVLARTEAIRLKYYARLKTAELDTIDAMMVDFRGEIW